MKLSPHQFEKIRTWMYRFARPLDLARWQYHFENQPVEPVLVALTAYQNEDGGFAHALEADNWNPHSSPLQTWCATEILREVGIKDKNNPIVKGILNYLASGHEFQDNRWRATTKETNDFPHAPWWSYVENDQASWRYNPTISLVGFILSLGDANSELYELARTIAKKAVADFISGSVRNDMHELSCFIQFYNYYQESNLNFLDIEAFEDKLKDAVRTQIPKETEKWQSGYVAKPSKFIESPTSLFYEEYKDLIQHEMKVILESEMGAVPWDWGNEYPEFWPLSKSWWQASIIIESLKFLNSFDLD